MNTNNNTTTETTTTTTETTTTTTPATNKIKTGIVGSMQHGVDSSHVHFKSVLELRREFGDNWV